MDLIRFTPTGRPVDPGLRKVSERFAADPEVLFSFLFGSQATGRVAPTSDVDLAVYLDPKVVSSGRVWAKRMSLLERMTDALRTDRVDLVVLNEAPPELAHRILRQGVLLSCRDDVSLIRFRVRTVNLFLDQRPMRELFFRHLARRVEEGTYGR